MSVLHLRMPDRGIWPLLTATCCLIGGFAPMARPQSVVATVGVGAAPAALAVNATTNRIYVANASSDNVTVIDGAANASLATVSVGDNPSAIAINALTNTIYVVNQNSDNVTVINGATNLTTTIGVGTKPVAVAVNSVTNKIYVANQGSDNVTIIDGATNSVATVSVGDGPTSLAANPATDKIYVANGSSGNVTVINGTSNATTTVSTGDRPAAVAINELTNRIYVANQNSDSVTIINGATNNTDTVSAGDAPIAVAVNRQTNKIYVANQGSSTVTVIDGSSNISSTVGVGSGPRAIDVSESTNRIYVANGLSNNVTTIEGTTNNTTGVSVGSLPVVVKVNPATNRVYAGNQGSNTVTVIAGAANLTVSKAFGSAGVLVGGVSALSFTIVNPNNAAVESIAFTDTLPSGLVVASPNGLINTCGGTVNAEPRFGSITLAGVTRPAGTTCKVTVNVVGTTTGVKTNQAEFAVGGVAVGTATASITVIEPIVISKGLAPASIPRGGSARLTLSIVNSNTLAVSGVAFTDALPSGLVVGSPSNLSNTCGGSVATGSGSVSLTGGTLGAGSSCTVAVNVTGTTAGLKNNSVQVLSFAGPGNTASASITVVAPAILSKFFGAPSTPFFGNIPLRFQLSNPNTGTALTGVGFTDTLPDGLIVSTPSALTGSCGSGLISAPAGGTAIGLANATIAAGAVCSFSVNVQGVRAGPQNNLTSAISSANGGNGLPASAAIEVDIPADSFQVSYGVNLNIGDSLINITNSGARGAGLAYGTSASITGALCLNVYAFSPDEQMISCCSCPLTPNGLVSLSAQQDLISNSLTPAAPFSIVIKLVATVPVAGTCASSAAIASVPALTTGMIAWSSTTQLRPGVGGHTRTETSFRPATLSVSELSRLTQLCTGINANGSGFGICRSCRLGGLGSNRL